MLRPLLSARRAELLHHVGSAGLPFVNDPSNVDPRFDRASIRRDLKGVSWLDAQAAVRSAGALAECSEALEWVVDDLAQAHICKEGDGWVLTRTDFPRELLRRLLLHIIAEAQPDISVRGDVVDRAIVAASGGEQMSLGSLLIKGGAMWRISPARPRRG